MCFWAGIFDHLLLKLRTYRHLLLMVATIVLVDLGVSCPIPAVHRKLRTLETAHSCGSRKKLCPSGGLGKGEGLN